MEEQADLEIATSKDLADLSEDALFLHFKNGYINHILSNYHASVESIQDMDTQYREKALSEIQNRLLDDNSRLRTAGSGIQKIFYGTLKHGISFRFNGKPINCYLKDVLVSPQNFAAVMCYKASLFRQYRTVNCIDIGDGTVDLLVIRKGQPDLSVRVSDRSGMAILRSEISNSIQQNYGIHLESSDVEQVLMQEATILDEEVVREIQKMAGDWMQRIINKFHAYVPDFRTNPAVFLGGGSLLLKQQIEKSSDFKYIEFIEDIRANAVGYEKMTALHIQKRQGV